MPGILIRYSRARRSNKDGLFSGLFLCLALSGNSGGPLFVLGCGAFRESGHGYERVSYGRLLEQDGPFVDSIGQVFTAISCEAVHTSAENFRFRAVICGTV